MRNSSELDFSKCTSPVNEAYSLPPECYCSDDITKEEISRIFRSTWIGLGRSDLVKEPGHYVCLDFAEQSIILLRDQEEKLHAFANTCRHRGARLLNGEGAIKGIRCPFHSWFYGLNGKLVAAPHMTTIKSFNKDAYSLIEYQTKERFGFIFISFNPHVDDIDKHLSSFKGTHSDWPLEDLVSMRRRELSVDCNWKMFLEVFNEYYHLPYVHPNSVDSIYQTPSKPDEVTGQFATQFGETTGTGGLLESEQDNALPDMPNLKGRAKEGVRYTWIFPNITFAANRDALWCYEAYPLGSEKCKVVQTACFHPKSVSRIEFKSKLQAYLHRLDAALEEDIPALVNQQVGIKNPDAVQGRFQANLEANVASFANWYATNW